MIDDDGFMNADEKAAMLNRLTDEVEGRSGKEPEGAQEAELRNNAMANAGKRWAVEIASLLQLNHACIQAAQIKNTGTYFANLTDDPRLRIAWETKRATPYELAATCLGLPYSDEIEEAEQQKKDREIHEAIFAVTGVKFGEITHDDVLVFLDAVEKCFEMVREFPPLNHNS